MKGQSENAAPIRAMILAAGLGTRMRPLTNYRAKPALPVCGRPVISLLLELLAAHGVREVLINLHHHPDSILEAVEADHPESLSIEWSEEPSPLGTGGGIERASEFLRGTADCLVMAGDMLLDCDLTDLLTRHRTSGRDVTLILRDDIRGEHFGTVGLDAAQRVTRIGKRILDEPEDESDVAKEVSRGLFTSLRFFRRDALDHFPSPAGEAFEDLRDWLAPRVASEGLTLGAEILSESDSVWEPVGTPAEYLEANLAPPHLPSLGGSVAAWGGEVTPGGLAAGYVVAGAASLPGDVELERCVVWDGEKLPAGFRGSDGVYAGGAFHACPGAIRKPESSRGGSVIGSAQ